MTVENTREIRCDNIPVLRQPGEIAESEKGVSRWVNEEVKTYVLTHLPKRTAGTPHNDGRVIWGVHLTGIQGLHEVLSSVQFSPPIQHR